jgi:CO dehydrogenase nickel-insertion accessory protein CooC1
MGLKVAVSGKGGVGKTTVAAVLATQYAEEGHRVIAVDADPASSLMSALGVPEDLRTTPPRQQRCRRPVDPQPGRPPYLGVK